MAGHQVAWTVFRFGPEFGKPFADEQFPVDAADELYKQMIPTSTASFRRRTRRVRTWPRCRTAQRRDSDGALRPASFPKKRRCSIPAGVRGLISIEQSCRADMPQAQLAIMAKIPILVMFGDIWAM